MKVIHVLYLSEVPGVNPLSGAENHLWMLLPALVCENVDVELIALLWNGISFDNVLKKLDELRMKGVKVTVVKRGSQKNVSQIFSKLNAWLNLYRILYERRNCIIHLHLELSYAPFIAWAAGCRKVIYTIHNDEPAFRKFSYYIRLRALNLFVKHFIAITNHVRSYFIERSMVNPEKVTKVYYGIEATNEPFLSRTELGIPEEAFVIGFVGRLTEQKNLLNFLGALRNRDHVLGVIVGDGIQHRNLIQYAKENQIGNVMFLGSIPKAERVMPIFDIFCLPSKWEGLGLVLIEAMIRGVPIIASQNGAISEILHQGKYGILFEPSVAGITRAIDFAFDNPAIMREKSRIACDYASRLFTVDNMVSETISVYHKVSDTSKISGV